MPSRSSRNVENCCCSNTPQPCAARFVITTAACAPWVILVAELQIMRNYPLHMLRLVYICPALCVVAGVIATVAYCKRISWGYIIALVVNGTSLLGWIAASAWLIISSSTSSGYFAKLTAGGFTGLLFQFVLNGFVALAFEVILCYAYIDSKREARSSNSIDRPLVPETSMNTGSAENEHSNES
ncbi:hypothetical protein DdX_09500 [Ditylenchus destructor]|uniref:Uncharacterized protein n=1 Tax=Ditylenchus destructor TaxID=166010 RepID=A0AAD4N247_9BILA|nr:hypothetical protein DdX_09500 [Ditylenchus destructor]